LYDSIVLLNLRLVTLYIVQNLVAVANI